MILRLLRWALNVRSPSRGMRMRPTLRGVVQPSHPRAWVPCTCDFCHSFWCIPR